MDAPGPFQQLARYLAKLIGKDPDKPRTSLAPGKLRKVARQCWKAWSVIQARIATLLAALFFEKLLDRRPGLPATLWLLIIRSSFAMRAGVDSSFITVGFRPDRRIASSQPAASKNRP